jgi:oligopeptide transport system substrate-binding protein
MKARTATVLIACATAGSLLLSACSGGGDDDGKGSGGSFTEAVNEPDNLTPGRTTGAPAWTVINAVFDPLTELSPTGRVRMLDAQSVTSKDQKSWTIKLRAGSVFQNGEKVTARSYADSWNATAYGPNGAAANYYFANFQGYDALNPEKGKPKAKRLSGLRVVDSRTLEVRLKEPFNDFPLVLATSFAFSPLPKAAFDDPKGFKEHPIGNGPFKMSGDWQHNRQIEVVRAKGYTGSRKPKADGITFRVYRGELTEYNDLRAGGLDVGGVPADQINDARRQLGDRLSAMPTGDMNYLGFPAYDKRFADPGLRKAISMAIDRAGIAKAVYEGGAKPMRSLLPPIVPGYHADACAEACTYDPAGAKKLLAKAGGFKGTLTLWFSTGDPTYKKWMRIIANSLKDNLGIKDVQLHEVPDSDYLGSLAAHKQDGPYRENWIMDYPSAQDYLQTMWGVGNRMGWRGASYKKFNGLIDSAMAAGDKAGRDALYREAEGIALDQMPMAPLWNLTRFTAVSDRMTGVRTDPYTGDSNGVRIEDAAPR